MARQTIGEFLCTLRKAKGFTQQQVADELGISNRTLSAWEQGRAYPDILSLPAIAELYGVTADEILQGERKPPKDGAPPMPEISSQSQTKLCKSKLAHAQTKNMAVVGMAIGGTILWLLAALLDGAPVWLIAVLIILSAGLTIAANTLLFVWHTNLQTSAGLYGYESELTDIQRRFAAVSRRNAQRVLIIIGCAWLTATLIEGIVYIVKYSFNLTGLGWTLFTIPLVLGVTITIAAVAWCRHTVCKFGDETQKATANRNDKLLGKCLFALIPFVIGIATIIIFQYTYTKDTTVYKASKEEFLRTFQTIEVSSSTAADTGMQAGVYFCDIQGALERQEYREYNERNFLALDDTLVCSFSDKYCNIIYPVFWEEDGQQSVSLTIIGFGEYIYGADVDGYAVYNLSNAYRTEPYGKGELYGYMTGCEFFVHDGGTDYSLIRRAAYMYDQIGVPVGLSVSLASVLIAVVIYAAKREKIKYTL